MNQENLGIGGLIVSCSEVGPQPSLHPSTFDALQHSRDYPNFSVNEPIIRSSSDQLEKLGKWLDS